MILTICYGAKEADSEQPKNLSYSKTIYYMNTNNSQTSYETDYPMAKNEHQQIIANI
jgi:hypothetical protein